MLKYLKDKTSDLHRDIAMELFMLPKEEVSKWIRFNAKSSFIFAQFYGDYYIDCAHGLWEFIDTQKLETTSGIPLKQHLKSKGIHSLGLCDPKVEAERGTFEAHVKAVEKRFWNVRFPVYNQWRRNWYEAYKEKGWFKTKTGFICQGFMKRNDTINYPVQGSAFHCLLWCLIHLMRHECSVHKMKTLIVGQIHDSIIADVPDDEMNQYWDLIHKTVRNLMDEWEWLIVPMEVEFEVTDVNAPWATKEPWEPK
jgi:hypothetical protein